METEGAQIHDPKGPDSRSRSLKGSTIVVHHFFSHLITFCTHNNHCNPWISGTCILQVIQSWLSLQIRMQRSLIGEEYGNWKQSDSPVGIAYFTGLRLDLAASIRIWILFRPASFKSVMFSRAIQSHYIYTIHDQIFTSLLTKGKNMVK